MTEEIEEVTPREVLDGEWVSCWEALEIAERSLKKHAVKTDLPVGQILATMAVTGYLPTISNDVTHTQLIPPGEPRYQDMTEEEREARRLEADAQAKATEEGMGTWRLVPAYLWASVLGFPGIEGKRVHLALPDFENSSIVTSFTQEDLPRNAPIWEVWSDPGFYMTIARNILVYKDGLYSVDRVAAGWPDEDDKYNYKDLDLTQLNLPSVLPLRARRLRWTSASAEAGQLGSPANGRSRGRPGGKNGEPIAALTIKLMKADEPTLSRYTADAAGAELQEIYAMLGQPARSTDNCRKDAAGVLRQVRSARGIK